MYELRATFHLLVSADSDKTDTKLQVCKKKSKGFLSLCSLYQLIAIETVLSVSVFLDYNLFHGSFCERFLWMCIYM
ncbi:predicted protein [Arabidopsis lyrata subsp. lyrata]|uniref:Predicted protein n=1 Tax=Arabidopsis lyrata subsp. lyrata TaxID=81972 RepID=D7MTX3_ARALL|nr:predicted protein [Arabidopsis lyrata subsp. lyrata]